MLPELLLISQRKQWMHTFVQSGIQVDNNASMFVFYGTTKFAGFTDLRTLRAVFAFISNIFQCQVLGLKCHF